MPPKPQGPSRRHHKSWLGIETSGCLLLESRNQRIGTGEWVEIAAFGVLPSWLRKLQLCVANMICEFAFAGFGDFMMDPKTELYIFFDRLDYSTGTTYMSE
jgi:hypothetical protein